VRLEIVLALLLCFGNNKEFLDRNFSGSAWPDDPDFRVIGNQHRRNSGWTDEKCRTIVAENGVIAIVALEDERLAVLLRQQSVACAEVPATRTLTKISADSSHIANLRTRGVAGCG